MSFSVEQTIPAVFRGVAARFAARPALVDSESGVTLTYRELDRASNGIAHALRDRIGAAAQPVAILVEHGVWPMVGMFGALKAGAFYASLEPTHPEARLRQLVQDLQPAAILTNRHTVEQARRLTNNGHGANSMLPVIVMEDGGEKSVAPNVAISPHDPALVVYTSGSTGEPKGVVGSHRHVLNKARTYLNHYELGPQARHSLARSTSYAGGIKDIYASLLSGATLCTFDTARRGFAALADWLRAEKITHYLSVVTTLRNLVRQLRPDAYFPDMRLLYVGGESLHKSDVVACRPHFPTECVLYHTLALTEVGSMCGRALRLGDEIGDEGPILMTEPARHEGLELLVLDAEGQSLPSGQVGQIAVRSPYLADGYWRKPELTRARFLPDPQDVEGPQARRIFLCGDYGRLLLGGGLEYFGRQDAQAKINGTRVDLGEVEKALLAMDGVIEAATVVHKASNGDDVLAAYLVVRQSSALTVSALRAHLGALLPAVMLPRRFIFVDALPKTVSGKVDRVRLPAPDATRPHLETAYTPPRTDLEREIVGIWQDVLNVEPIGIRDHFLDLGGNSILAARVVAQLARQRGIEIPIQSLLSASTVEAMAQVLVSAQVERLGAAELERLLP